MAVYSDDYIERWGNIFTQTSLPESGVTFEAFLRAPRVYLADPTVRAIVVAARLAESDLAAHVPQARCRNGRFIEPLHHHAWPRRPRRVA